MGLWILPAYVYHRCTRLPAFWVTCLPFWVGAVSACLPAWILPACLPFPACRLPTACRTGYLPLHPPAGLPEPPAVLHLDSAVLPAFLPPGSPATTVPACLGVSARSCLPPACCRLPILPPAWIKCRFGAILGLPQMVCCQPQMHRLRFYLPATLPAWVGGVSPAVARYLPGCLDHLLPPACHHLEGFLGWACCLTGDGGCHRRRFRFCRLPAGMGLPAFYRYRSARCLPACRLHCLPHLGAWMRATLPPFPAWAGWVWVPACRSACLPGACCLGLPGPACRFWCTGHRLPACRFLEPGCLPAWGLLLPACLPAACRVTACLPLRCRFWAMVLPPACCYTYRYLVACLLGVSCLPAGYLLFCRFV